MKSPFNALVLCVLLLIPAACVPSSGGGGDDPNDAAEQISSDAAAPDVSAEKDGLVGDISSKPEVGTDDVAQVDEAERNDEPFSFFVTSIGAMQDQSGSIDGFGGDLGGLEGADEICRKIAATVDAGHKTWRAFLSATDDGQGNVVHAIDRIGEGPWYDRNARLVASSLEGLLQERPDGDPQVAADLPNEFGIAQKQYGDNHDTLTGSNEQGQLNDPDPASTCQDWTSKVGPGSEKKVMGGHSWPREPKDDDGGPGDGNDKPKAPPPWVNACQGLDLGDECNVDKGKKKFDGVCEAHPEDANLVFCMPPDGQLPGGPGGGNDGLHWIASHTVPGCAAGVQLEQVGGGQETDIVGGGGGYGGIYCFALEP